MHAALLVARLLLASLFAVAAVGKLADRAGSKQAMVDFGVPTPLAAPLGVLLPLVELTVAAALIPTSTAWWSALGALTLLLLFVGGIGANLARGRKPDCRCFGQLRSEPAGLKTLARNVVLAAVAGFIVWRGYGNAGASAIGWLAAFSTAQVAGLVVGLAVLGVVAAQCWILLHLLRQYGRLLVRVESLEEGPPAEGLPVGETAPDFELPDLEGETLTLESLRGRGKPVVLLFTDPDCGPCKELFPDVGRWQEEHSDKLTIAVVSRGQPDENATMASEHGLSNVLMQEKWEVLHAYRAGATPSGVLIGADGTIGSRMFEGLYTVRDFLARTVEQVVPRDLLAEPADGRPAKET
jgi:methylamine dehydrogenase accessory protein MauD